MFDFVFIILTYKNYNDLQFFLENNRISNSKIIVVNSFFDEKSKSIFEEISKKYEADFINIENKGYGYSNNIGVKYAVENYDFKFLIISNPDVEIKKFNKAFLLSQDKKSIFAPKIKTLRNKHQNPFIINYSFFFRWLYYMAVKYQLYSVKYFIYAVNGLVRRLFIILVHIFKLKKTRIYSSHGSFFIIGSEALKKMMPLYYEQMFLYQEEHFLARKAYLKEVKTYYIPFDVEVKHFEDGSQDFNNKTLDKYSDETYIKYFKYFNQ